MVLTHIGGGCMIGSDSPYPCDDSYKDENGDVVSFSCTTEAHFKMPEQAESREALLRLDGVKLFEKSNVSAGGIAEEG